MNPPRDIVSMSRPLVRSGWPAAVKAKDSVRRCAEMDKGASFGLLVVVVATVAIPTAARGGETGASEAIVFERNGDLYAVPVDGGRTVRLTKTPTLELEPAVSPDVRSIAYTRPRGSRRSRETWYIPGHGYEIWTMSLDGRRRTRLTRGDDFGSAWSPDGDTIFFSRYVPFRSFGLQCISIFRVARDGRGVRRVTGVKGQWRLQYHAAVSPDGRRVAFTDESWCEGGTTGLALRVVDTSGRRTNDLSRLPGNGYGDDADNQNPTWSPDGSRLAFNRFDKGKSGIHVANRDGSGLRRITPGRINVSDPAWSPDGAWIAFVRTDGHGDLYVIHPDGTGLRQLTRTNAREFTPAWMPQMPAGNRL